MLTMTNGCNPSTRRHGVSAVCLLTVGQYLCTDGEVWKKEEYLATLKMMGAEETFRCALARSRRGMLRVPSIIGDGELSWKERWGGLPLPTTSLGLVGPE
jgi:hypothetical protein